jgi:hypothetical protein
MNKMREEFDKWWDTQSTGEYWKPVEAAWGAWQAVIRLTPNNAPFAFAKPFSVLQRGLVMQHIAICNHEGHGYTIPIYTEAPQTALSQPAAVEGWKLVPVEPTDRMLGAGLRWFDCMGNMPRAWNAMLSAAPTPPSTPAQQSVREAFDSWYSDQIWGNESWGDGLRLAWEAAIEFRDSQYTTPTGPGIEAALEAARDNIVCGGVHEYTGGMSTQVLFPMAAALSTSPLLDKNDQTEGGNSVTLDKRDLFDFMRVAIMDALESDEWLNQPRSEVYEEAYNRTASCLGELYASPQPPQPDSNELVEAAVNRFLGWKLPADFAPDCGISFNRSGDYEHPEYGRHVYEPTGTNLFTAEQARSMFKYCLAASLAQSPSVGLNTKKEVE